MWLMKHRISTTKKGINGDPQLLSQCWAVMTKDARIIGTLNSKENPSKMGKGLKTLFSISKYNTTNSSTFRAYLSGEQRHEQARVHKAQHSSQALPISLHIVQQALQN